MDLNSDPPNPSPALLDASPHLRDLSLTPSAIKRANPVIIHPQLRDLILPLERGRVLYPRGNAIEELTWHARDREIDEDGDEEMGSDDEGRGNVSPSCPLPLMGDLNVACWIKTPSR